MEYGVWSTEYSTPYRRNEYLMFASGWHKDRLTVMQRAHSAFGIRSLRIIQSPFHVTTARSTPTTAPSHSLGGLDWPQRHAQWLLPHASL